jgi:hypothetical protein
MLFPLPDPAADAPADSANHLRPIWNMPGSPFRLKDCFNMAQ